LPPSIAEYDTRHKLDLDHYAGPEAQVAALADDIAYNNHDIDDGLRAGMFAIADFADVPLVGTVFNEVALRYPRIDEPRLIHESIRRMIDRMVRDMVVETRSRLSDSGARSADDVRALGSPVAAFSEVMRDNDRSLKRFLYERMYRHYRVNRMSLKARRVVRELFQLFVSEPECLPSEWRTAASCSDVAGRARIVADYLAGMTDRFALDEHRRLFDTYAAV